MHVSSRVSDSGGFYSYPDTTLWQIYQKICLYLSVSEIKRCKENVVMQQQMQCRHIRLKNLIGIWSIFVGKPQKVLFLVARPRRPLLELSGHIFLYFFCRALIKSSFFLVARLLPPLPLPLNERATKTKVFCGFPYWAQYYISRAIEYIWKCREFLNSSRITPSKCSNSLLQNRIFYYSFLMQQRKCF